MTRRQSKILRVALVATVAVCVFGAATQKQIHPQNGTGGPVVIAVLADGYTSEADFDEDADNFINHSLLADPYYQSKAADMRIVTFFEPVATGQQSNYEFTVGAPTDCGLGWTSNTATLMNTVVGAINPTHTIVIGDHDYNLGCASGTWTYVAEGGFGTDVLLHEFGHVFADLYDEYALRGNGSTPYPNVIPASDRLNCSTNTSAPHWQGQPGTISPAPKGCDFYEQGIVRPSNTCRMSGNHSQAFCVVCKKNMDDAFNFYRNPNANPDAPSAPTNLRIIKAAFTLQPTPPPAPPAQQSILRLVVEFNPSTNAITVKRGTFARGAYVPSYRRLGQYVYEVTDADKTLEVGVLPRHVFNTRSYQGASQSHGTTVNQQVDVIVQVPGLDQKTANDPARSLRLSIYRLGPNVTAPRITPAVLASLKASKQAERVAEVAGDAIRKVM